MYLVYAWNQYNEETDTEWFFHYGQIQKKATVCFNGSEYFKDSKIDWLMNFAAFRCTVKDSGGVYSVHWGFYKKWVSIQKRFDELLRECNPEEIEITGYSQGASTATLCHRFVKLHYPGIKVRTVVAGSPKVFGFIGYKKQAELCKDVSSLRYGADIVAHVPFFMRHVGNVYIKNGRPGLSVKDHLIHNYIGMVKDLEKTGRI
jgi:hypothetical protein